MDEKNIKKRRCSNCGAFLNLNDKVCYVCGEVQIPEVVASERDATDTVQKPSYTFKENEDFVVTGDEMQKITSENIPEYDDEVAEPYYGGDEDNNRMSKYDDEMAEPYYEGDKKRKNAEKRRTKKVAIVCVILILVAALAAGTICFCYYNGFFGGGKEQNPNKITVYFDRPSAEIDLYAQDGTVYNWTGDVEVAYLVNGKEKTKECNPDAGHNTLWKVVLPSKAKSIYFYQSTDKTIRTQVTPSFTQETVYYVAQNNFNALNQLPLGECSRASFKGIGVNYATIETTEAPTTEEATTEPETTEPETTAETEATFSPKAGTDYYDCTKPDSWEDNVVAIEKNNCVTYYDKYNYNNYGMGMLVSVYVFDADDPEADDFDKVDKVLESADQTKKIVVIRPSDIQYNDADEEAMMKYVDSNKETKKFISTITGK